MWVSYRKESYLEFDNKLLLRIQYCYAGLHLELYNRNKMWFKLDALGGLSSSGTCCSKFRERGKIMENVGIHNTHLCELINHLYLPKPNSLVFARKSFYHNISENNFHVFSRFCQVPLTSISPISVTLTWQEDCSACICCISKLHEAPEISWQTPLFALPETPLQITCFGRYPFEPRKKPLLLSIILVG